MNLSDEFYLWLAAALAIPMLLMSVVNGVSRSRGHLFLTGWTTAIFVYVCWIAGIALIFHRLS